MNYLNHGKAKISSYIFKSSNKSIFYNFFYKFFVKIFSTYIKVLQNLSAKYYEENKERIRKRAPERYQNLSKEKK